MTFLSEQLADTPLVLLTLGDASGTVAADSSGNSHSGIYNNGVTLHQAGLLAGTFCAQFDGVDDYVSLLDAAIAAFPSTGAYTLEALIFPSDDTGDRGIVGYGNYGSTDQVNALKISGGTLSNYWFGDDLASGAVTTTDGPHHLLAEFDAGGTLRTLYLDNVQVAQDTPSGSPAFALTAFTIGTANSLTEWFVGKLQNVAVYGHVLGGTRRAAHYAAFSTLNPPTSLSATANVGTGTIDLTWVAPVSGAVFTSYTLGRSTTAGTETSYVTLIGAGLLAYSDTAVTAGVHYFYTLVAHNAGGDSAASNEANAVAPLAVERTVTVQNTDIGINTTPATGSTAISLLSPDNVTPVHTITGKALTILTAAPTLDNTGFWSEALIPTGDLTPPGCVYQFSEPGGQITNLAFVYADGPTITLSAHYPTQNIVGQIKVYLTGLEIDGLIDATLPLTAAISADAGWVGGAGTGQLISANNPISFAPDGQGNASVYVVRQSQLSTGPSSNPYLITNTRSGTPIAFLAPDTYDDALLGFTDLGVYAGGTTYAAKAVVRDPSTDVPYSSIAGGNVGHNPASSPSFWAPHPGVRITAHAVLPGSSVSPVATEGMIATISFAAIHHASPATVAEHFEEQAFQLAILRMAGTHGRQTLSPLRQLL